MSPKSAAGAAVFAAIKAGLMLPADYCEACGVTGRPSTAHRNTKRFYVWHHHSYLPEHRLDVIPLCHSCHKRIHCGSLDEPRTGRRYPRPAPRKPKPAQLARRLKTEQARADGAAIVDRVVAMLRVRPRSRKELIHLGKHLTTAINILKRAGRVVKAKRTCECGALTSVWALTAAAPSTRADHGVSP